MSWFVRSRRRLATFARRNRPGWRANWALAQDAMRRGDLTLVDDACAAALRKRPDFWFARELPKHARGWYSQNGQDEKIEEFFQRYPARHRAFVEVGAFDGVHYSNVRRLHERHGWSGLCVEPVPENFQKLVRSYEGTSVRCVQAAVTADEGFADLHVSSYPHLPDWGSDVATLRPAEKARWYGFTPRWRVERVPAAPLTSLIEHSGLEGFDLLSIDAEGSDLEVLRTLDLDKYRPLLIVIEYGESKTQIAEHVTAHEYMVWHDNGQDLFAADGLVTK